MGFALWLFCYKCKKCASVWNPPLEELEDLLEENQNLGLKDLIKRSEPKSDLFSSFTTPNIHNMDRIATIMGENNALIPIFVKDHKACDSFATVDSYTDLPWEPTDKSWESTWKEWRCDIFHPRVLIDDFNICDWNVAVNFVLPKYSYVPLASKIVSIIRREYHRLLRQRIAESNFRLTQRYSKQVPSLVELASFKLCVAVNGDIYVEHPIEPTPPGVRKPHRFRPLVFDVDPTAIDALPSEILSLIQEISLIGYDFSVVKPFYMCLTKHVTVVDVSNCEVCLDVFCCNIEACTQLKVVKMSNFAVSEEEESLKFSALIVNLLKNCPMLSTLDISYNQSNLDFSGLSSMETLALEYLDVSGTTISEINLLHILPKCHLLTNFYANECNSRLAEAAIPNLNSSLQELHIVGNVSHVLQFKELKVLKLEGMFTSAALKALPNLKKLYVDKIEGECEHHSLTDLHLNSELLTLNIKFPKLQTLSVVCGVLHIIHAQLSQLEELNISVAWNTEKMDSDLQLILKQCPNLKILNLMRSELFLELPHYLKHISVVNYL